MYAGSVVGAVFAVDAATGQQVWRADLVPGTDNQVRVIAVRDNRVYVTILYDGPFYSGRVYALDAGNGTTLWKYDLGRLSLARDAILDAPSVAGSAFLAASDDGRIAALNVSTGGRLWTIDPIIREPDDRRMTVSGTVLVATSTGGTKVTDGTTVTDFIAGYDFTTAREAVAGAVGSRLGAGKSQPGHE